MNQTPNYGLPLLADADNSTQVLETFDQLMGDNESSAMAKIDTALSAKIPETDKGANGGVAELDVNGKLVSDQLPLGETSITAYPGDLGAIAYSHSQTTGNPHNTTKNDIGLGNVPNVTTNDQTPTFSEASARENISSGDKISVLLGKISKWFSSFGTAAWEATSSFAAATHASTHAVGGSDPLALTDFEINSAAANIDSAVSRALPGGELDAGDNYIVNAWFSSLYRINQRGVSGTISTVGYFLDMWELVSGSATLTTTGITLNGTIRQKRENSIGLTCTASVRTISGTAAANYDDSTKIFTITSSGGEIEYAKLEIGSYSTSAYDIPPTPAEQKLNRQTCMRYLYHLQRWSIYPAVQYGTDYIDFSIPLPVVMRITPAIVGSGISIRDASFAEITGYTLAMASNYNDVSYLRLRANKTAHGFTSGVFLEIVDDATFLSAEL